MVNVAAFQPRPGVAVVPDGFTAHHLPTVDGTHTATVEYWTGPAAGENPFVWDPVEKTEVPNRGTRTPDRPIPARIQRVLSEKVGVAGGQQVTTRSYMVTTNEDTPDALTVAGFVRVLDGDPYLDGHWLAVQDIHGNSFSFERAIICLDNQG